MDIDSASQYSCVDACEGMYEVRRLHQRILFEFTYGAVTITQLEIEIQHKKTSDKLKGIEKEYFICNGPEFQKCISEQVVQLKPHKKSKKNLKSI